MANYVCMYDVKQSAVLFVQKVRLHFEKFKFEVTKLSLRIIEFSLK